MKERPILFTGEMVRALLDGRKSQTRRVLKNSWQGLPMHIPEYQRDALRKWPYGQPGDRLWVRETWAEGESDGGPVIIYRAGGAGLIGATGSKRAGTYQESILDTDVTTFGQIYEVEAWEWKPSIFMPRWASRITLEITSVRVERVQEICEEDAKAEGVQEPGAWMDYDTRKKYDSFCRAGNTSHYQTSFRMLWDSINLKRGFGWDVNPWVWVITFKRVE